MASRKVMHRYRKGETEDEEMKNNRYLGEISVSWSHASLKEQQQVIEGTWWHLEDSYLLLVGRPPLHESVGDFNHAKVSFLPAARGLQVGWDGMGWDGMGVWPWREVLIYISHNANMIPTKTSLDTYRRTRPLCSVRFELQLIRCLTVLRRFVCPRSWGSRNRTVSGISTKAESYLPSSYFAECDAAEVYESQVEK